MELCRLINGNPLTGRQDRGTEERKKLLCGNGLLLWDGEVT